MDSSKDASATDTAKPRGRGRGRRGLASSAASTVTTTGTVTDTPGTTSKPQQRDVQDSVLSSDDVLNKTVVAMKRPGVGTVGRRFTLETNFFELRLSTSGDNVVLVVQRYHVNVTDHRDRKLTREDRRLLFWKMVSSNPEHFPNAHEIVYDDDHCCYCLSKLNIGNEKSFDVTAALKRDANRSNVHSVKMIFTAPHTVDMREAYRNCDLDSSPVQILDLIITQNVRCSIDPSVGQNIFVRGNTIFTRPGFGDPKIKRCVPLNSGREMWSGLHMAVKLTDSVSHTVFYQQCSLIEFLCLLLNGNTDRGFCPEALTPEVVFSDEWSTLMNLELKGLLLKTDHILADNGTRRTYYHRFVCVGKLPENQKFLQKVSADGEQEVFEERSVLDYYNEKYPGRITRPNLPCIMCGRKDKQIAIPMELLSLDDSPQKVPQHRITGEMTSKMIKAATTSPPMRRDKIVALLIEAQQRNDPFMQSFGLSMNMQPQQVEARVLPTQRVEQQDRHGRPLKTEARNGQWRMDHGTRFLRPADIGMWAVVVCNIRKNRHDICHQFCGLLPGWLQQFGVKIDNEPIKAEAATADDLEMEIQRLKKELPDLKFIVAIKPEEDKRIYASLKTAGEIKYGVITQALRLPTIEKAIRAGPPGRINATALNICLKINMKNGGINNGVEVDEVFHKCTDQQGEPTLFLGIDVSHPGPNDQSPSFAAVVGNIDLRGARWAPSIRRQASGVERVNYLHNEIRERILQFYRNTNGVKPKRLIVYRDGVSDSEFGKALNEEMRSIKHAILSFKDHQMKITYIVVQKRHHTRFFPPPSMSSDPNLHGNVPPGTVVDTDIVSPTYFDFYLCSHLGLMGTSRPAHYTVLHDDNQFTADEIQMLSYKLCHVQGRCTKSVSIPVPVYLADLACTRARVHWDAYISHLGSNSASTGTRSTRSSEEEKDSAVRVVDEIKKLPYFA